MNQAKLSKLRKISQIVFLALFFFLLFKTEFRGSLKGVAGDISLAYPVNFFFRLDPLVAI